MDRFQGQTAVVTGASGGLGEAFAAALAAEGAFVYLGCRRRADRAEAVLAALVAAGGAGAVLPFDLTDEAAVSAAFDRIHGERGAIHVLVNNAGLSLDAPFALLEDADAALVLDVNLLGALRCARAAVRPMIAAGRGVIINVGSLAGGRASPGQAAYAASKAGLEGLTRTLAAELAPKGIRVNALAPGMIDAGMAQRMDRRIAQARRAAVPLGRLGHAEEVARALLFLASADASYVTGQVLVVDGGLGL